MTFLTTTNYFDFNWYLIQTCTQNAFPIITSYNRINMGVKLSVISNKTMKMESKIVSQKWFSSEKLLSKKHNLSAVFMPF